MVYDQICLESNLVRILFGVNKVLVFGPFLENGEEKVGTLVLGSTKICTPNPKMQIDLGKLKC